MSSTSVRRRRWSRRTALLLCAGLLALVTPVAVTANASTPEPHRGGPHALVVQVVAQAASAAHSADAIPVAALPHVVPAGTPGTSDVSPTDSVATADALLARGPPVQAAT